MIMMNEKQIEWVIVDYWYCILIIIAGAFILWIAIFDNNNIIILSNGQDYVKDFQIFLRTSCEFLMSNPDIAEYTIP